MSTFTIHLHSCPPPSWKICPRERTGGETAQAWSTGTRITGHGAYGAKGNDCRSLPPTQTCRIDAAYEVMGYRLRLLQNTLHRGRSVGEHSHLSLEEGLPRVSENLGERPAKGCRSICRCSWRLPWIARGARPPCHGPRLMPNAELRFCYQRGQANPPNTYRRPR